MEPAAEEERVEEEGAKEEGQAWQHSRRDDSEDVEGVEAN